MAKWPNRNLSSNTILESTKGVRYLNTINAISPRTRAQMKRFYITGVIEEKGKRQEL